MSGPNLLLQVSNAEQNITLCSNDDLPAEYYNIVIISLNIIIAGVRLKL